MKFSFLHGLFFGAASEAQFCPKIYQRTSLDFVRSYWPVENLKHKSLHLSRRVEKIREILITSMYAHLYAF